MKRTLFVGDVHGCYDEMMEMIEALHYDPANDTLYFTGDLINKGPDSLKVIDEIVANGFLCVQGNHEARLLQLVRTSEALWSEKEKRMAELLKDPFKIAEIVGRWPLWRDTPNALLVHAGIEPGKSELEKMDPNVILSVRTWDGKGENLNSPNDPPWFKCATWPKLVIFGHWAAMGLVNVPGFLGLDSGCVYGKALTGYSLEEKKFYSVPAKKIYSTIKKKSAAAPSNC